MLKKETANGQSIPRRDFLKYIGVVSAGAGLYVAGGPESVLGAVGSGSVADNTHRPDTLTSLEKEGIRVGDYGLHITTPIGWDTPVNIPQLALAGYTIAKKLELKEQGQLPVLDALFPSDKTVDEKYTHLRIHSTLNRDSIDTFLPYELLDTLDLPEQLKDELGELRLVRRSDTASKFSANIQNISSHYSDIDPATAKQAFARAFDNTATDDDIAYIAQIAAKPDIKNYYILGGAENEFRNNELRQLPPSVLARVTESVLNGSNEGAKRVIIDEFLKQLPTEFRRVILLHTTEGMGEKTCFDIFSRLSTEDAVVLFPAFSTESKKYICQQVSSESVATMLDRVIVGSTPQITDGDDDNRFAPLTVFSTNVFDAQTLVGALSTTATTEKFTDALVQLATDGAEEKVRYVFDVMDRLKLSDIKRAILTHVLAKSVDEESGSDAYFQLLMTELTRSERCGDFDHILCQEVLDKLFTSIRTTFERKGEMWRKRFAGLGKYSIRRFFTEAHDHDNFSLTILLSRFIDDQNPSNNAPVFDGLALFLTQLLADEERKEDAVNYLAYIWEHNPVVFTSLFMDGLEASAAVQLVDLLKSTIEPSEMLANMVMYYITRGSDSPLRDVFLSLMKDKLAGVLLGLFSTAEESDLLIKIKASVGAGKGEFIDFVLREYLPTTAEGTLHLNVDGNTVVTLDSTEESLPLKELYTFENFDGKVVAIDGKGVIVRFNPASGIYPEHYATQDAALQRYKVPAPTGWINFGAPDQRMRERLQDAMKNGELFRIRWGPTDLARNVNLMHGLKHFDNGEMEAEIPHFAALLFSILLSRTDKHGGIEEWSRLTNNYLSLPSGSQVDAISTKTGGKSLEVNDKFGIRPYRYEIDDNGKGTLVCEITSLGQLHGDYKIDARQFLHGFNSAAAKPIFGTEELMFLMLSEVAFSTGVITKVAPYAGVLMREGAKAGAEIGVVGIHMLIKGGELAARSIRWGAGKLLSRSTRTAGEIARAPVERQIAREELEALQRVQQERRIAEAAQRIEQESKAVLEAKRRGEILADIEQVAQLNIQRARQVQGLIAQATKLRTEAQSKSAQLIIDALEHANDIIRQAEIDSATIRAVAHDILRAAKATSAREQWLNNLATNKDRIITEMGNGIVKFKKEFIDEIMKIQKKISGKISFNQSSILYKFTS